MKYLSTILLLLITTLFLTGCNSRSELEIPPQYVKYDVSLFNATHDDVFSKDNRTLDKISFMMRNNERFSLNCSVGLALDNSTEKTTNKVRVGLIEPDVEKSVSLSFEMPTGKTNISIKPICYKN